MSQRGKLLKQLGACCAVGDLPTCEHECDWAALAVSQRMDFRRAPAARAADGLVRLPPPLSARRRAMRFDRGTVDQNLRRRPAGLSERMEQLNPHAFLGPANEAVVERLPWSVLGWRIDPATAWPRSRLINSRPVLAAAGACASSRRSNGGRRRVRRLGLTRQPERRRDPAPFMPTPCRRDAASASDIAHADHRARIVRRVDLCRDRRNGQSIAFEIGRDRLETLLRYAPDPAPRTSRPSTPAQPKRQIPISRALHTAGSFLGDFPTPDGVRNSSRKRNSGFWRERSESGPSTEALMIAFQFDLFL